MEHHLKVNKPPPSEMTTVIHIEISPLFHLRVWLASKMIWVAAWLLNANITIQFEDSD